ncbi:hypothetical protein NDU88_011225 [Pleurodeles waltl]|uniref:Uncharacterized protein n=1 Tax=Pleurodeles waltl TaxID=8319 RepID=A0AAV7QWZ9_PLEWA|nr:hypothetical protein NDU88_011225 [Pleurodeles waltl]
MDPDGRRFLQLRALVSTGEKRLAPSSNVLLVHREFRGLTAAGWARASLVVGESCGLRPVLWEVSGALFPMVRELGFRVLTLPSTSDVFS